MNSLPRELLSTVIAQISIRDIASLASVCKVLESSLRSILDMLFFEVNMLCRIVLEVIDDCAETQGVHKLHFDRDNYLCKVAVHFPYKFKLSLEHRLQYIEDNGEMSSMVRKRKACFKSVNQLMQNIKYNCKNNVDIMNILLFPKSTKIKISN